jgi:hypothetical protein
MICQPCKAKQHGKCKGGSWCDCQHKDKEAVSNERAV